jgi:hypothetical protein
VRNGEEEMIFGTIVKVTIGFYLGCIGTVRDQAGDSTYLVHLECEADRTYYQIKAWFKPEELEVVKLPKL